MENWATYALKKELSSRYLGRQTKCALYRTLLRSIFTYRRERWPLKREVEDMLRIFERRILRRIYGPIKETRIWISRYNHELYKLNNVPDIVTEIKVGRL
jgi:hypothetical protein